jgi:hypothetical protein
MGVQFLLWDGSLRLVAHVGGPPYTIFYTGPAGLYYIAIYTEQDYNTTKPYTLRVTHLLYLPLLWKAHKPHIAINTGTPTANDPYLETATPPSPSITTPTPTPTPPELPPFTSALP